MTGSVSVSGGATAIDAELAAMNTYAALLDRAAGAVAGILALLARTMADPALLPAGLLDPVGGATLAARLTGTAVLAAAAEAGCRGLASALRAAVDSYRAVDVLDSLSMSAARAAERLPASVRELAARPNGAGLQAALLADPGLVDLAVHTVSLPVGPVVVSSLLALPYPDGPAVVTPRPDGPVDDALGPPRTLGDLVRGLAVRASDDDGGGAVDVRFLQRVGSADRRVVVDIAGTTIWNTDPWRRSPQATDMGTNLRSLANRPSVMSRGVITALAAAGVRPDEPILLVGHSQGGMVAAQVATELTRSGEFHVAGLVTAGSPIGSAPVPSSVPVLSLENADDPVPHLDGTDNPGTAQWLTVHGRAGGPTVLDQHSLRAYQAIATDADASSDPALAAWRQEQAGFFEADSVRTEVFQIRRGS